MITTTREFDTYEEAVEAFYKAQDAYEAGYGFYPHARTDLRPGGDRYIAFKLGKWTFTYSRGDSCD